MFPIGGIKMSNNIESKKGYYTKNGSDETYEFEFKTDLSLYAQANLINKVINALTNDETKTYYSILKDLFFKFYLIQLFTDVDVDYILDTNDLPVANVFEYQISEMQKLVEETTICEILMANVGDLIENLYKELNKALTYKTGIHEDYNNIILSLQKFLNLLIGQVENTDIESLIGAAKNLSGLNGSGIGAEDIVKAFQETDDYKSSQEIIDHKNQKIIDLKEQLQQKGTDE